MELFTELEYDRPVLARVTYRLDHCDSCSGIFLSSEIKTAVLMKGLSFQISNPNLAPGHPSYVANAPLTDAEAKDALDKALAKCQAVHPGPWPK